MKLCTPLDTPTDLTERIGRHVFGNTHIAGTLTVETRKRMWDDLLQARRDRRQHSPAFFGTSSGGDAA